jgi:gas vesicle protein
MRTIDQRVGMEYDDDGRLFNFFAGLICGLTIGAGVALVLAPDSGKKTRKRIQRAAGDLRETAADRWEELAEDVRDRVEEVLEGARSRFS